jgi:hypothetical protein
LIDLAALLRAVWLRAGPVGCFWKVSKRVIGADRLNGGNGNDLLIPGAVANESSSVPGDANDLVLIALLSLWGSSGSDRTGLGTITQDGDVDHLTGGQGDDDFSAGAGDLLADLNAPGMGADEQF